MTNEEAFQAGWNACAKWFRSPPGPITNDQTALKHALKAALAAMPAQKRPALPVEAEHEASCEHQRSPTWLCACPRPIIAAMPAQGWRDGVEAAAMIKAIKDGLNGWIGITDLDGAAASIAAAIRALTPPEEKT